MYSSGIQGTARPRFAAVNRTDARRRAGGNIGNRSSRCYQRGRMLAVQIISLGDADLRARFKAYRDEQAKKVLETEL